MLAMAAALYLALVAAGLVARHPHPDRERRVTLRHVYGAVRGAVLGAGTMTAVGYVALTYMMKR